MNHPRIAKGSNLIFIYQLMVRLLVPFLAFESLKIFLMGYITMYLGHAVAPQRIVRFISMLPGIGKIFLTLLLREIFPRLACQVT